MRLGFRYLGNLLAAVGLLGAGLLGWPLAAGPGPDAAESTPVAWPDLSAVGASASALVPSDSDIYLRGGIVADAGISESSVAPPGPKPITGLRAPGIGLDTTVVPARMVPGPLGPTWEVPAFAAGHAEFSAGAGRPGTAVLFGHVSSLRSGRVFQHLERVRAGDDIEVVSGDEGFLYRVVEVQRVPRTSVLTLEPSATAGIVLITCTGQWLPALGDYAERLIVRGQLVG